MTTFLPIEPMGVGTRDIESLLSIFARSTRDHGTTLAPMARLVMQWWREKHGQDGDDRRTIADKLYSPFGTGLGSYTDDAIKSTTILSEAFSIPSLHRHTFRCLHPSAAPNGVGLVRSRAWCPACFQDDVRLGRPIFDRLIWSLQPMIRCVDHRIRLLQQCAECGLSQTFVQKNGNLGVCYRCESSLYEGATLLSPFLSPAFGERDCCELVEAISLGELDNPVPDAFSVFQDALNEILSPVRFVVDETSPSSGSKRAFSERSRPTFLTMLRRAHVAGVSLVNILKSPTEAANAAGELEYDRRDSQGIPRPRHPKQVLDEARAALEAELAKGPDEDVPSLAEIAKKVGVSKGFYWHHFNSLVRAFASRRQSQTMKRTRARFDAMRAELDGGVLRQYLLGMIHSQDAVVDLLVERCGPGKAAARRLLVQALARHTRRQAG